MDIQYLSGLCILKLNTIQRAFYIASSWSQIEMWYSFQLLFKWIIIGHFLWTGKYKEVEEL